MSLKNAKAHLAKYGLDGHVRLTEESSATVELAAQALGVEAGRIAKTYILGIWKYRRAF